jgi:gamma-glutamyltranspeptidase
VRLRRLDDALRDHGTMRLRDVLELAIYYAQPGHPDGMLHAAATQRLMQAYAVGR